MSLDISDGFVWVVQDRVNAVPVVMSVHTDKHSAWEAAVGYMDMSGRRDFSVNPMKLNKPLGNVFEVPSGRPLTKEEG